MLLAQSIRVLTDADHPVAAAVFAMLGALLATTALYTWVWIALNGGRRGRR